MQTLHESLRSESAPAHLTNIQAIIELERETRHGRTRLERMTDVITGAASSPGFIIAHLIWFVVWVVMNLGARSFDPYPFNLLTLVVSLEAIVLTGFVLMAQNRMTQGADRRAHLDLQVNMLAEEELTAILRVVCLLAEKNGVDVRTCDPNLERLLGKTDVKVLAGELTRELNAVENEKKPDEDTAAALVGTDVDVEEEAV